MSEAHAVPAAGKPEPPAWYRWTVLMVMSLAMFGNYYLYDTIAPVADLLKEELGFFDEQIGILGNSAYAVGAIIFLMVGGVIVDRLGTRFATLLFGSICAIAGFVTVVTDDYVVMWMGRFLLGLGAEPLIVALTAAVAKWFKGKELAFAMGVNLLIGRLASYAADRSPTWAKGAYDNWQDPLWIGAYMGLTCVLGAVAYWFFEVRGEARYSLGEAEKSDKLVLSDIIRFDKGFWVITALCVAFYAVVFPFRVFAIKYFMEAHGADREAAGALNSMLPLASMIATPLIGLLVDKVGKRATFMAIGALIMLPVFPILAYTQVPLSTPMFLLGISFSLIPAIMWPAVAYIVEQNRLGSAYALMFMLQQGAIYFMGEGVGKVNDNWLAGAANPGGYMPMMWIFTSLGVMAVIAAFILWRMETGPNNHGLETIKA